MCLIQLVAIVVIKCSFIGNWLALTGDLIRKHFDFIAKWNDSFVHLFEQFGIVHNFMSIACRPLQTKLYWWIETHAYVSCCNICVIFFCCRSFSFISMTLHHYSRIVHVMVCQWISALAFCLCLISRNN